MKKYFVSESMYLGELLPCVRDDDGNIVAAGCTAEDAKLFAKAHESVELIKSYLPGIREMGWNPERIESLIAEIEGGEV